jgi:hypothetical protein
MKFEVKNVNINNPKSSFLSHQIESTFKFNNGVKFDNDIFASVILYVPKDKTIFSTEEIERESFMALEKLILGDNKIVFEFKVVMYEYLPLKPKLVFDINERIIIN